MLAACAACHAGAAREPVAAAGRLTASPASHDFGEVVEGDALVHAFPVTNPGRAPVRVARIERSPACRAASVPEAPIAPGGTTMIPIECDSRNRPPKLVDVVAVIPTDGSPPLRLELRATIQPILAFDPPLASLETPPGGTTSRVFRIVGAASARARPRVVDAGGAEGLIARALAPGDPRGPGIELGLSGRKVATWSDRVTVSTGVDHPRELTLPYIVRVTSGIEVDPSKPYFDLRDPMGRSQLLSVKGRHPGFRVLAAKITSGPFRAAVEESRVRVTVDAARIPTGQRGVLGTLVIVTNDQHEPRKEVQLFALGAIPE